MSNRPSSYAAALALYDYLKRSHLSNGLLVGPDPGVRLNARLGRFVKSYLPFPWHDEMVYLQSQAYWIMSNVALAAQVGDGGYQAAAMACAEGIADMQSEDGSWPYPNPEWKGRVATVEGCMAGLGMLEAGALAGEPSYTERAVRWYEYMIAKIGFSVAGAPDGAAINYFTGWDRAVPNNNTLALWFVASLSNATADARYLEHASRMLKWVRVVQLDSGELPYLIGSNGSSDRIHFLCYQYNAFEFMDLVRYHRLTGDPDAIPVCERLAGYLASGLTSGGRAKFDCSSDKPEVLYYTSALGHALRTASDAGFGDFHEQADRCYRVVLDAQTPTGAFAFHSRHNYRVFTDRRSYPRYLSMILYHLVSEASRLPPGQSD